MGRQKGLTQKGRDGDNVVSGLRDGGVRSACFRQMSAQQKHCARFLARIDWVAESEQPPITDDSVRTLSALATAVCQGVIRSAVGIAKTPLSELGRAGKVKRKVKRPGKEPGKEPVDNVDPSCVLSAVWDRRHRANLLCAARTWSLARNSN